MTSAVVLNEDSHVPLVLLATLMWPSVFLLWAVAPHALLCYVTLGNSFWRLEIWS